uniref:Uncharacterized protein n=1 Tax=Anopheles minimus TaxID=112268 RepID=A0A182W308_9DIPT
MKAINRNALCTPKQRLCMTATKHTTSTSKRYSYSSRFMWVILFCQCVAYCMAEQIITKKHLTRVEQQALTNNTPNTENVDLPRPIITAPTDHNLTQPDALLISPRRHKTRRKGTTAASNTHRTKPKKRKNVMQIALQSAARKGLEAMIELYDRAEPNLLKRGAILDANDPGTLLAQFSASNQTEMDAKAAYATLVAAKTFKESS